MSGQPSGTHLPKAIGFLMAAHVCFVLLDATGKALARDMGVPLISLVRHAGHALLMLVFLAPTMGLRLIRTDRPGPQLVRGLLLTGFTLSFFTALRHLPQAEATAINFLSPFFVMLLAGRWLGERVTWRLWLGVAGGFIGMWLIVRPGANLHPLGVACVLVTVACNIGFQLLTRSLSTTDHSLATIFLSSLIGIAVSAAAMPFQEAWGGWPATLSTSQVLLMASMGVSGVVSQWCLVRAYAHASASFIAPLVFLQIVWATASGWVFFGQLPDALGAAGMLLIVASGIGATLAESRARTRAVSP